MSIPNLQSTLPLLPLEIHVCFLIHFSISAFTSKSICRIFRDSTYKWYANIVFLSRLTDSYDSL